MTKHGGRPRANINWSEVDNYLKAQCTGTSIAGILGIDAETLYNRCKEDNKMGFTEYSARKKAEGIELLKAIQYKTAMAGNVVMQIWLGKQYANQRDRQDLTHTGIPPNVQVNVTSKENAAKLDEFLNGKSK